MSQTTSGLDSLLDCWEFLGKKEKAIVVLFAKRVLAGQRKYGEVSTDKKNWTWESLEETLDGSFYLLARTLEHIEKLDEETYSPSLGD